MATLEEKISDAMVKAQHQLSGGPAPAPAAPKPVAAPAPAPLPEKMNSRFTMEGDLKKLCRDSLGSSFESFYFVVGAHYLKCYEVTYLRLSLTPGTADPYFCTEYRCKQKRSWQQSERHHSPWLLQRCQDGGRGNSHHHSGIRDPDLKS
jgi:hypothetical protein